MISLLFLCSFRSSFISPPIISPPPEPEHLLAPLAFWLMSKPYSKLNSLPDPIDQEIVPLREKPLSVKGRNDLLSRCEMNGSEMNEERNKYSPQNRAFYIKILQKVNKFTSFLYTTFFLRLFYLRLFYLRLFSYDFFPTAFFLRLFCLRLFSYYFLPTTFFPLRLFTEHPYENIFKLPQVKNRYIHTGTSN